MPTIPEFYQYRTNHEVTPLEAVPTLTEVLSVCPLPPTQYAYGVSGDMRVLGLDITKQVNHPMLIIGDSGSGKSRLAELIAQQASTRDNVRVDFISKHQNLLPDDPPGIVYPFDISSSRPDILKKYVRRIDQSSSEQKSSVTWILYIDSLPLFIDMCSPHSKGDQYLSMLKKIASCGSLHNIVVMASMNIDRFVDRQPKYDDLVSLFPKRIFGYTKNEEAASSLGCLNPHSTLQRSPSLSS